MAHPKDEARPVASLQKASHSAVHRLDAVLHRAPAEKAVLSIVDQSTVDVTMTATGDQTTDLDQKVATVAPKADHRADVHQGLRMADLAVTETIVRDRPVAKAALKDLLAEKDDQTETVDRLVLKAKDVPNDVKLL